MQRQDGSGSPGASSLIPATTEPPPSPRRRVLAAISLTATGLVALFSLIYVFNRPLLLLAVLVGLGLVAAGGWWLVTERAGRRQEGIVLLAGGVGVLAFCALATVATITGALWRLLLLLALTATAVATARGALIRDLHELDRIRAHLLAPKRPVLLCNPRSGSGKVGRFGLADLAQELGIEVVMLQPGDDLAQLARDAVRRGADCLGMAGGDGSLATVAAVAVAHDVPFVCVSAGTRNHFALDLGLAKEDPAAGVRALAEGVERRVDFATVNGRLFLNNVSLGVYATIVQDEAYRDAKLETARAKLQEVLAPGAEPFDLQFATPEDREIDGAFLVLVSNNPYSLTPALDPVQRRVLDSGRLGVLAISGTSAAEAGRLVNAIVLGAARRDPNVHVFDTTTFEVRSRADQVAAGIDGEAVEMSTPLDFRIHPRGLRLLVPAESVRAAEVRRVRGVRLRALTDIARGRPPRLDP